MVTALRPERGGFIRPFGCGWFIRQFLLGHAPEGAPRIDPGRGAPQQDIKFHYKEALYRAYARDRAEREISDLVKAGEDVTPELAERIERRHYQRIPAKITSMRYHSFTRYFHMLKQLGWVEPTGEEEPSTPQEAMAGHPDSSPLRYYRLTKKGREAPPEAWSNPQAVLYPEIRETPIEEYFEEKMGERKYRPPSRRERFLVPVTAGIFIRDYLMGLGPEGSARIDADEGDWPESIFGHYKEHLRRAYARDAVEHEDKERTREGLPLFTPEQRAERTEWHREGIPYKLHRARYNSFYRYFHWLKQLGWVEPTGRQEESYIQGNYPDAPPRRYYRLSGKGREASEAEWYRPQLTLYPDLTPEYFSEKNGNRRKAGAPTG